MARIQRSVLGIELQERHIRVVEVTDAARPTVLNVAEAAMPERAIRNGVITRPETVAAALRRLLQVSGINAEDAIFGIPATACTLRTLTIPPVPDAELAQIVDGEIKHFRIFSTHDAVYNHFLLRAPRGSESGRSANVLMVGAEGPIVSALREIADKASLNVLAFEPIHIGMYRTATESLRDSSAMVLTISEERCDVTLHSGGEICLFREIDLGADTLLTHHYDDDPFTNPALIGDDVATIDPARVKMDSANTLSIELKRSVEYFQREYPAADPIDRLIVVTTEPAISDLTVWLSGELNLPVEIVSSYKANAEKESVRSDFKPPNGARYGAAYGLAMRGAYSMEKRIPIMDLFVRERSAVALEEKRKGIAGSLLVSIAAVAIGIVFAYKFGIDANHVEHALGHVTDDITDLQTTFQRTSEDQIKKRKQYDLLTQDGVPLGTLIDAVASKLSGSIGLTDIQAGNTGQVTISGEAKDENSVIKAADWLTTDPIFQSANVSSLEKLDPEGSKVGIKFRINSTGRFGKPPKTPGGAQ